MPSIDYANKVFLAPMVRVGTLPFRLLALEYGAVWSEELVDKRIIGSVRKYNSITNTIEYWKDHSMTFSTHPDEKGRIILQLGTADADLALQAALTLKQDVAGIDVNCGCPKAFSVHSGMGAALLSTPEKLKEILTTLVNNLDVPVTCKIRLLESKEKTLDLVRMIESTGVKALTVHCRTRDQRPTQKANWEALKDIVQTVKTIPVVVNGDVFTYEDIARVKEFTGASSVMIARGALCNPSIFSKEGFLPVEETVKSYIKKCIDVNNGYGNTKYVLLSINGNDSKFTKSDRFYTLQKTKSIQALW
ncbi:tRNA-dihydrouridine(20) synthase [NAD(P)+]-like [Apophysomyces sp. BC1034]|nr:tRNA-dihydrouridine(20) synthase [NAD(P)+]-like [Apophysomyces sp. BC1015]KAG0183527.1 tRNA-dihydrouridine(20) synthase [NAD(P)+]-like [Apophysomyces sp. BC1021]KAG0194472.1 tRNA-dihydrouridine(20) synthase [NAD(P)+]-like [Apophysomyces sp. BC1034]